MHKVVAAAILAGVSVWVVRGQEAAPRTVHLTLHEGTNMAAALSPDGRTIAIDLLGTLWTLPAQGGAATPITEIFLDARQPAWSPDGRRIAFQAYRDSTWQIWTVNADGTDLKPVTSSPYDDREPTWAPDGRQLAFSSDRGGSYDIWVLTLASGDVRQVTSAPSNEFMPSWRSATEIAYVSDRREKPGIYAAPSTASGGSEVFLASADGALAAPAFGPRGDVAFNAIAGSHSRLMIGDRNIADPDEDVFPFRPQWLPDGDVLYTADGKIKRRAATGGAARVIEFGADVSFIRPAFIPKRHRFDVTGPQPVRGVMHPALSPDGSRIAFAALGDLWLMPVGGAARRLTSDPALDTAPAWSPDGRSLAYSSDRGGSMNIWIRDLDDGTDRQVTRLAAAAMEPAWSPDASRLAFVDAEGQLQVVDVKSGAVRKIHDHLNEPGRPSWSPDGTAVVVSSLKVYSTRFREGTNQVLRVPLDGSGDRWFDPAPHKSIGMREDYGPVWSPDGTQMAAIVDGLLTAWPVGRDGAPTGPPRPLTAELAGAPTWSGDSKQILFQTDSGMKLVDVAARRVVREIAPRLTWTPAPPSYLAPAAARGGRTTVHAGRFWDGSTNGLQRDVDIVIEGNRITSVDRHRAGHDGAVIDASDETVIPGLIEIHTHLSEGFGEALGRAFLAWGITTVRNPATNTFETMEFRESFESGARVGPRLITTGEPFDGTRIYYPGGTSLGDTGQLPLELQHARDFGYDFVKTYVRLPDLMQKRIIEAAHAMGMPVTSHELYPAVAYGADGVEHIRGTSRRGYSPKVTAVMRSYQDVIDLLTASKMTLTPTIGIQGGFRLQTMRDASWMDDPRIAKLYPASVTRSRNDARTPATSAALDEAQRLVAPQERTVLRVVRGGGRVTAGTDAPINPYGLSLLMELEDYASAGLTPVEVLRTATAVSAEAMGVGADIGTVAPGRLADLAFINGDPLQNIKDLQRVRRVMKDGVVYDVASLVAGARR
jgi:Tol biopolymer transport system component/imidazolonepropionase-like amidohydrolase